MATACGTVVLRGFRELPPRERASLGWRYDVWLRRNGREGGFRVLPPGRQRRGAAALQRQRCRRKQRIGDRASKTRNLWLLDYVAISTSAAPSPLAAGFRAVAQCTGRPAALIKDAAGCSISLWLK